MLVEKFASGLFLFVYVWVWVFIFFGVLVFFFLCSAVVNLRLLSKHFSHRFMLLSFSIFFLLPILGKLSGYCEQFSTFQLIENDVGHFVEDELLETGWWRSREKERRREEDVRVKCSSTYAKQLAMIWIAQNCRYELNACVLDRKYKFTAKKVNSRCV